MLREHSEYPYKNQVNSIIKSCNYHMREFKSIHKHLDWDTGKHDSRKSYRLLQLLNFCRPTLVKET